MSKIFNICAIVVLLFPFVAQGDESSHLAREMKNIFIAESGLQYQVYELNRQLEMRMFIDLGQREKNFQQRTVASFLVAKGTRKTLLDDYCRTRELQWHYWAEAECIWIEPKDKDKRRATADLSVPLNYDQQNAGSPFANNTYITADQITNVANAKGTATGSSMSIAQTFTRERAAITVGVKDGKWPKSVLDFIRGVLLTHDVCAVSYEVVPLPELRWQALEVVVSRKSSEIAVPTERLMKRIMDLHNNVENIDSALGDLSDCWHEAFRRYQYDRRTVTENFVKFVDVEKLDTVNALGLSGWDTDSKYALMTEIFDRSDRIARLKMLEINNLIPDPEDYGPKYLKFWQTLAKSEDKTFSDWGKQIIKNYEEELAKRGGRWERK
jgi:hypothetical protein